jgi:2-methylfumaryl-CoA hydratase
MTTDTAAPAAKAKAGNFFEDFALGRELVHATPRTLGQGDAALHLALTGSRFALTSADSFAARCGLGRAPIDPLLAFHVVFGKSVADVSANAVANLGYAEGRIRAPLFPGDTVSARSVVIGLKENTNRRTGTVYVRTEGLDQRGEAVLDYVRWVMVAKRDPESPAPKPVVPALADHVALDAVPVPAGLDFENYDWRAAGAAEAWEDYAVGERIDHVGGATVEEAEHMAATRLAQNPARPHFDARFAAAGRFGRRIVYGGHVISLARALSFNGLANAQWLAAINAGRHVAPVFAGDTIGAWSEVLDKAPLPGRADMGALRLRTVAVKDRDCADFPGRGADGRYDAAVVLDLDYTVLMPRRRA